MDKRFIIVVGDVILDRYFSGLSSRLSPEAPVPIVDNLQRRDFLGGAANVAANISAMGEQCYLFSVIGRDKAGTKLARLADDAGFNFRILNNIHGVPTTTKTRYIANGQQLLRFDKENTDLVEPKILEALSSEIIKLIHTNDCHALIFSDYDKGLLTQSFISEISEACVQHHIPIIVDPKARNFWNYERASLFKPNNYELSKAVERFVGSHDGLQHEEIAPNPQNRLRQQAPFFDKIIAEASFVAGKLRAEAVLVTCGIHGMKLCNAEGLISGTPPVSPNHKLDHNTHNVDVVGAGDVVTAAMAIALSYGLPHEKQLLFANESAANAIKKPGTSIVDREILTLKRSTLESFHLSAGSSI